MADFTANIQRYIDTETEVLKKLDVEALNEAVNAILEARERGGTIYTLGNGGSAATASHMVCDLAKGCSEALGGPKFRVECLCDNTPIMMAIANDYCYEDILVRQLQDKLEPRDLVIAISGSGNSENVVRAARYAKEMGAPVLGITGYDGGKVKQLADYTMHAAIDDMQIAEDVHMIFDHMTMRVIETLSRGGYLLRRYLHEWKASRVRKILVCILRAAACFPMLLASVPAPIGGRTAEKDTLPAKAKTRAGYRLTKRVFDIVVSVLGLIILSPLLLLVSLLILLDDPKGAPIFVQTRVGKGGKEFRFYKFRSMVVDAEAQLDSLMSYNEMDGPVFKIKDDPRITRVGRIIRKTSIDELPQLWNILRGEMSVVGPRPPLPREVEQYTDYQRQRLSVTPGLTCYWQVQSGRNRCSFDDWVEMDLQYIRERSVRTDLKLIFMTFGAVLGMNGE